MTGTKNMTTHDLERIVLASMIAPETAKNANKAIKAAKFKPEEMFTDADTRREYDILVHHGADVFDGHLGGVPLEKLAAPDIGDIVKRLKSDYQRRLAETDRTLDQFETPGPDSEDPDCLFQNRWLRRGACGAILATSGVGKSSYSIQAATLWAAGQECLGIRPLRPLKIGIFQSEDDEYDVANFRDRIRIGLAAELDWTPEQIQAAESRVTFCALDGSTGARFVEHLRRKQTQHHFDLIIINPLFAFFGGDMNDGNAMTAFLRHGIDPLIKADETKCGCIIIHHTGKPNKERMALGDQFASYLGSGSSEFTNYIRSALTIMPKARMPSGVYNLIAAKHGDKLEWKNADGTPTKIKTICHANILPEYAEGVNHGMIYWVEPDEVQLDALKKSAPAKEKAKDTARESTPKDAADDTPPILKCANMIAEYLKTMWTEEGRPANATKGQRDWVIKLPRDHVGGATRSTKEAAYNLIAASPDRFGLREVQPNNNNKNRPAYIKSKPFYVAAEPADATDHQTETLNAEQENLFDAPNAPQG